MEDFIDNFNEFRTWLYQLSKDRNLHNFNSGERSMLNKIINKFEELDLKDVF